ncbi:LLM class flavin-dependent oxidoreductase [Streptomyces lonarensis]|uniref:LLM class flavin-dependent oxidoreductase n=1 Tax=Streptomyces lonarensis TaxID=700599 RepID=A0A7X6D1Z9_9ACTN|nr:LLM class flavin-dependent oxidoreductase [Streptomyces lonarensis]NJQ06610.1 LLM class flavin-dependent oxidoreductase [Streptomyces lonarensis]
MRVGTFVLAGQFAGQAHDEVLHRVVRSAEVAEEAGLDAVWLAEHHFIPYGICPSAATLAGFLLGRTRRIGVGTAVSVLPTTHPVALGEQAALLHLTSEGRFTLGVGRGGPWVDLAVFGTGLDAYERDFPEALDLLLRWLREDHVGAAGERFRFPSVPVVPRPDTGPHGAGPPVVVACTSAHGVRTAARRGLPMLLGMHAGDEERAEMVSLWRRTALETGADPARVRDAGHVAAGVVQVGDSRSEAVDLLRRSMPEWFRRGLAAYRTVDGRPRRMRDPLAYTELLCELHPVGSPRLCADRLARTAERTGVTRFALLSEGSGGLDGTEENLRRLGAEVLPLLPHPAAGAAAPDPGRGETAPSAARAASGRADVSVSSRAVRATG